MFKNLFRLFFPIAGGSIIGLIINKFIDFNNLVQPPLSPPKAIFPIAWSILYILIGMSYYIYRKDNNKEETISLYYLQLVFNFLWSIIFFNLKLRFVALIWIIALLIQVILLMKNYYKENKTSFYLLIPYLLWLIFATYLNLGIVALN